MTPAATRVDFRGDPTKEWLDLLEAADLTIDAGAPVSIEVLGPHQGLSAEVTIAIVERPDQVALAQTEGALDVVVGRPSPQELAARVRTHEHYARTLEARTSEATHAVSELRSTQDLLERLIDATPNPVMAVDNRGRVLVFNRAAEQALGYAASYAREHMHVTEIYANPGDATRILNQIHDAPHHMITDVDVRLRARSGDHIPVLISAGAVMDADGEVMASVGVFQDMRAEQALRTRLQATTEQLIASEKRAATIEVAGATAHELNQPLTAVMGTLEILESQQDLPDEARKRVSRAYGHLERMADIVRALARTTQPQTKGYVGTQRILDLEEPAD